MAIFSEPETRGWDIDARKFIDQRVGDVAAVRGAGPVHARYHCPACIPWQFLTGMGGLDAPKEAR